MAAVVAVAVCASIFGWGRSAGFYRPTVRRAVEDPVAAPIGDREPGSATARRIVVITGSTLVICLPVAVVSAAPGVVAGIALGNGGGVGGGPMAKPMGGRDRPAAPARASVARAPAGAAWPGAGRVRFARL